MPRGRLNNNKKKRGTPQRKAASQQAPLLQGLPRAQQLLATADHAAVHEDPQQAVKLYTATEKSLENVIASHNQHEKQAVTLLLQVWEKRAELKVSLGDQEGAFQDYQCALRLMEQAPTDQLLLAQHQQQRATLYLYVGQLQEGATAVDAYEKGISCLQAALVKQQEMSMMDDVDEAMVQDDSDDENADDAEAPVDPKRLVQETTRQLAAAYCSVAEVYLTDLCFEDGAEQQCEAFLAKALELKDMDGEPVTDALQTAASLRLSQDKGLEAVEFALRAFQKMRVGCEELASLVGLRESTNPEQATELLETEAVKTLPGFEFRCQTAKLLLECAGALNETKKGDEREALCLQAAVDVLGSLLAENDEVAEIWYLTGSAFAAMTPPNAELATHYWERTLEMLTSVKESLGQEALEILTEEESEDLKAQLNEVSTQVEDVQGKLAELPVESSGDANDMEE